MLKGNILLLRNLPEILGTTVKRFCQEYAITKRTWERWTSQNGEKFNPSVIEFVAFCNKLHLAPHKLIQSDLYPLRIDGIKELFPPGGEWKDASFQHHTFVSLFGKRGPTGLTIEEMMKKMNKTPQTFREGWKQPDGCTLRINDLFLFCSIFNIDINRIIIDPNGRIDSEATQTFEQGTAIEQKLRQRERRIRELNEEIKKLKSELASEQRARLSAENRLNSSGISTDTPYDWTTAAEDEAEYC